MSKKLKQEVDTFNSDLARAAEIDLHIKALTAELTPIKDRIKADAPRVGETYAAGGYTAQIEQVTTFNLARAKVDFGGVPEAHESVVTQAGVKAYLQAKHPKKWEEKFAEYQTVGRKISFGAA